MKGLNPFAIAQERVDACAKVLKLDPAVQAILRVPVRELRTDASAAFPRRIWPTCL